MVNVHKTEKLFEQIQQEVMPDGGQVPSQDVITTAKTKLNALIADLQKDTGPRQYDDLLGQITRGGQAEDYNADRGGLRKPVGTAKENLLVRVMMLQMHVEARARGASPLEIHGTFFNRNGNQDIEIYETAHQLWLLGLNAAHADATALAVVVPLAKMTTGSYLQARVPLAKISDARHPGSSATYRADGSVNAERIKRIFDFLGHGYISAADIQKLAESNTLEIPGAFNRTRNRIAGVSEFQLLLQVAGEEQAIGPGLKKERVISRKTLEQMYDGTLFFRIGIRNLKAVGEGRTRGDASLWPVVGESVKALGAEIWRTWRRGTVGKEEILKKIGDVQRSSDQLAATAAELVALHMAACDEKTKKNSPGQAHNLLSDFPSKVNAYNALRFRLADMQQDLIIALTQVAEVLEEKARVAKERGDTVLTAQMRNQAAEFRDRIDQVYVDMNRVGTVGARAHDNNNKAVVLANIAFQHSGPIGGPAAGAHDAKVLTITHDLGNPNDPNQIGEYLRRQTAAVGGFLAMCPGG